MSDTETQFVFLWSFQYQKWIISNSIVVQTYSMGAAKQPSLLLSTNWRQGHIAEDSIYTTQWTLRSQVVIYLEPSLLWSTVTDMKRCMLPAEIWRLINNDGLPGNHYCNHGTKLLGSSNTYLIWLKFNSMRNEPISDATWMLKNLRLDSLGN